MRLIAPILLLTLATLLTAADDAPAAARILAWTKTLSADEFEGRAPGTRGEDRTVGYLEQEFRKLGLKPGNPDGTYVQKVPLAGITSRASLGFRRALDAHHNEGGGQGVGGRVRRLRHHGAGVRLG